MELLERNPQGGAIHRLKFLTSVCNPDLVYNGEKTFEVRRNDRDFKVGDWIRPRVVDDNINDVEHPLNHRMLIISYITDWHVEPGWCILGVKLGPEVKD